MSCEARQQFEVVEHEVEELNRAEIARIPSGASQNSKMSGALQLDIGGTRNRLAYFDWTGSVRKLDKFAQREFMASLPSPDIRTETNPDLAI